MKQNFEQCMGWLLEHEGGYVNHPNDPGGQTNHGVTRAVYEQYAGRQVMDGEMEGLTHDDVYPIYRENYWDRIRADDLPSGVDWSVFDWGVEQDGGIGPMTLQAVLEVDPAKIIEQMHHMRDGFYRSLSTFDTFGRGWIRRNDETKEQALNLLN